MYNKEFNIQPWDICIYHVGGSLGSYGPIDSILNYFSKQCVVFTFEARENDEDDAIQVRFEESGVRTVLINACIAETAGLFPFYINKHGASSSMFPPSHQAMGELCPVDYSPEFRTWGENTELDRVVTLKTIDLKEIINQRGVIPDVMSIDAQGMEYRIMKGIGSAMSSVNSVVSEVEFFEIYNGQGLFHEQMSLLESFGFRLVDLLNSQYWYPGSIFCGKGFFNVAEALWFKKINSFLELNAEDENFIIRGIKLAAVALAFERYSYSFALLRELRNLNNALVTELCFIHGFGLLLKMEKEMKNSFKPFM